MAVSMRLRIYAGAQLARDKEPGNRGWRMRARKVIDTSPLLISVDQAAYRLSVGRSKIYGLAAEGKLKLVKIGRATRVVVESIEALVRDAARDGE
jgi:excisionase family DNA binding protein